MAVDHQRTQHLFRKLSQLLGQNATRPHPESVHDLRTISRRVEALLDTLATEPDRKQRKLRRRLKRLRRRAGRVRDIDVQILALRTLKIGRDSGRKAQLARHLSDRRARRERKLRKALDAETVRDLRRRLIRAERTLRTPAPAPRPAAAAQSVSAKAASADVKPAQREEVQPVSLALRMFATVAKQQGAFTEATLHRFRTRSKRVRYVAEMAGDDPEAKRIVSQIKRMQDAIGDWHDWFTLAQTAQKLFAEPVDSPLIAALRNVTRAKFMEATRHASDLKRNLLGRAQAAAKAAAPKAAVPAKAPVPAKARAPHRAHPRPRVRRAPSRPKPAAPAPSAPVPEAAPPVAPEGLHPHNFPVDKTPGSS